MKRLLIIGGSDAGISAALRAREIDSETEVTVVVSDRFPNYSICGLPFYLSGEIKDWKTLAHRTVADIEKEGIHLVLEHTARAIDPSEKLVTVSAKNGHTETLAYDRLLIATGATSVLPDIQGLGLPGVFTLRWMDDCFAVQQYITDRQPRTAIIIGGGYIGMEMADALSRRGLKATVVEYLPSVLTTVDPGFGNRIQTELERHGVAVNTGVEVKKIEKAPQGLMVSGTKGFSEETGLVLVAVGAEPETALAQSAGVETGIRDAIKVDHQMQTSLPEVYAAGDCVETWHKILQEYTYMPLGSTAHKQGRVAGENMVGGKVEFQGSLGTQAVKVFDLVAAGTGLRDHDAEKAGFSPLTVEIETWDHKVYYPGARMMQVRITGDRRNNRILGAQIIGHRTSEVSKRIDVVATAIYNNLKVEDLSDIDLSYTPPLSSPWDPLQMCSQQWSLGLAKQKL